MSVCECVCVSAIEAWLWTSPISFNHCWDTLEQHLLTMALRSLFPFNYNSGNVCYLTLLSLLVLLHFEHVYLQNSLITVPTVARFLSGYIHLRPNAITPETLTNKMYGLYSEKLSPFLVLIPFVYVSHLGHHCTYIYMISVKGAMLATTMCSTHF